mmetsp:Transcript_42487/g.98295  ORF Transcript_42487/g.98295 Transcript_42487/m.98295 type:complete len:211 (-) Transcript_42487:1383-2015(-)
MNVPVHLLKSCASVWSVRLYDSICSCRLTMSSAFCTLLLKARMRLFSRLPDDSLLLISCDMRLDLTICAEVGSLPSDDDAGKKGRGMNPTLATFSNDTNACLCLFHLGTRRMRLEPLPTEGPPDRFEDRRGDHGPATPRFMVVGGGSMTRPGTIMKEAISPLSLWIAAPGKKSMLDPNTSSVISLDTSTAPGSAALHSSSDMSTVSPNIR